MATALDYTLIRSDRRTLAVQIDREGRVIVRAPRRCPQGQIDRFLAERRAWIETHVQAQRERAAAHPEPDAAEEARLKALARAVIPGRVEHFSRRMGLYPAHVTITGARTRFGSCSGENRLSFSWRLMQYPMEAVDYVVVHELAHIAHKNHGKDFYARIAAVLPDWKERRALLKQ